MSYHSGQIRNLFLFEDGKSNMGPTAVNRFGGDSEDQVLVPAKVAEC